MNGPYGSVSVRRTRHSRSPNVENVVASLNGLMDAVAKVLMVIAAIMAFSLAFFIIIEVGARHFSFSIYGVPEAVRETIIIIVFLQLPYVVRFKNMLSVDFFVETAPKRLKGSALLVGSLLGLIFFAAIAVGSLTPALEAWQTFEHERVGYVRIPVWPAKFAITIGSSLAAIFYLVEAATTAIPWLSSRAASPRPHNQSN